MADLTFLPWEAPFLPQAAETLVSRFRTRDRIDLSRKLLVLPGARAGRRLMELLSERATELGLPLIPPRTGILTVGRLPEELYLPPRPLAPPAETRRAWATALERVQAEVLEVLYPNPQSTFDLPARTAIAHTLDSLNRTLGAGGKTFSDVARACEGHFPEKERWEALAMVQEEFWRRLREAGHMDREEARRLVVRDGAISASETVVLMGITDLPRVIRAMVEAMDSSVHVLVHAPQTMEGFFDPLGLVVPEPWLSFPVPVPEEALVLVDKPGDQASRVLGELAALGDAFSPDEVAIGVPDPTVVPFLEQRLGAYGVPFRYAGGFPLTRTSPYRFLDAVAAYLSSHSFQALAALLRHPIVRTLPGCEDGPRVADSYFEDHLPGSISSGTLPSSARNGPVSKILRSLEDRNLLGGLAGANLLSEWMPKVLHLLGEVFGRRPLDTRQHEEGRTVEACLRLREAARVLHGLPRTLDETCSASEAIRVLLREVREEALPPDADREAVELLGWLEVHTDDAPILLMTGVNEPVLPEAVNADPFLPNTLRARLGLEDNLSRQARDAYRLTACLHSKHEVRLVSGRRSPGGDPLRPSRLLLTGTGEDLARRIQRFTLEERRQVGTAEVPPLGILPAAQTGFPLPPEARIPVPDIPRPFPVTAFRSLLADPYLWALERILRLQEASDQARELDPLGFGSLAHRVLEVFGRSAEAESSDVKAVRGILHKTLDRVVEDQFGTNPLPTVPLQVEQLRTRLDSFAKWQAAWVAAGWRILAAEARTGPEGARFMVDEEPIFLSGRMDRIDIHRETKEWVVFDYKTGDSVTSPDKAHRGRTGWKDLQLPLYRHMLGDLEGIEESPPVDVDGSRLLRLAYLPLTKDSREVAPRFAAWTEADMEEADEAAREIIRALRRDGAVAFDPASTGRKAWGSMASLLGQGVFQETRELEASSEGTE
jgi:RecB family exonuclease